MTLPSIARTAGPNKDLNKRLLQVFRQIFKLKKTTQLGEIISKEFYDLMSDNGNDGVLPLSLRTDFENITSSYVGLNTRYIQNVKALSYDQLGILFEHLKNILWPRPPDESD